LSLGSGRLLLVEIGDGAYAGLVEGIDLLFQILLALQVLEAARENFASKTAKSLR